MGLLKATKLFLSMGCNGDSVSVSLILGSGGTGGGTAGPNLVSRSAGKPGQ